MRLFVCTLAAVLVLPAVASAANVQHGLQLYGRFCVSCHGPNGEGVRHGRVGQAPARIAGVQSTTGPRLIGVGALSADFYLRTGYMPLPRVGVQPRRSRLVLGSREIDDLIAYVASLGHGPPVPAPHPERGNLAVGQHLFTEKCAGCHQIVGAGGYVTGAVPPALGAATPVQIAEAVRIGPYVMPKFSTTDITNAELDSIVRYVEYTKHPDDRGGWSLEHVGPIPEGLVTWFLGMSVLVSLCIVLGRRLRG